MPEQPSRKPDIVVDDGSGLVFAETRADYLKSSTCYACGKKGHLVYNYKSTSEPKIRRYSP